MATYYGAQGLIGFSQNGHLCFGYGDSVDLGGLMCDYGDLGDLVWICRLASPGPKS